MAYVDKAGDTMTGDLNVNAVTYLGDANLQYPVGAVFKESVHTASGSKRTAFNLGSGWQMGQDFGGNGPRNLYLYNIQTSALAYTVSVASSAIDFKYLPTVNGTALTTTATAVAKNGDQMSGLLSAGDPTQQFPTAFAARDSTHSSGSKRASISIGSGWQFGQDSYGTGIKDLYFYNTATANSPLKISIDDTVAFTKAPTVGAYRHDYLSSDVISLGSANAMDLRWGVAGDGSTDDSAAINALIQSVYNRGGGRIFFPSRVYAIASPVILKPGVYIEGVGPSVPNLIPTFKGSQFRATANMAYMIGQSSYTNSINSVGIAGMTLDLGYNRGLVVNAGIQLAPIAIKIIDNHIANGSGYGVCCLTVGDATAVDASWINWMVGNVVEKCDINVRWESTDSYITNNYFSFGRSGNVILDSTGNVMFTANMIDNTGKDSNMGNGTTAISGKLGAVAVELRNESEKSKDTGSRDYYAAQFSVIGNGFVNNNNDIYCADSSTSYTDTNHVINSNRFTFCLGTPVLIGSGVRGGMLLGNSFQRNRSANTPCVSFRSAATGSTEWSLGPNIKHMMPANCPLYSNAPTGTTIIGNNN